MLFQSCCVLSVSSCASSVFSFDEVAWRQVVRIRFRYSESVVWRDQFGAVGGSCFVATLPRGYDVVEDVPWDRALVGSRGGACGFDVCQFH